METYVGPTDHIDGSQVETFHSRLFKHIVREVEAEVIFNHIEAWTNRTVLPPVSDVLVNSEDFAPVTEVCLLRDGVDAICEVRNKPASEVRCGFLETAHETILTVSSLVCQSGKGF